jgi:hypothetical protein
MSSSSGIRRFEEIQPLNTFKGKSDDYIFEISIYSNNNQEGETILIELEEDNNK